MQVARRDVDRRRCERWFPVALGPVLAHASLHYMLSDNGLAHLAAHAVKDLFLVLGHEGRRLRPGRSHIAPGDIEILPG